MTQHITAVEALTNAKLAYEAGTLQAQLPPEALLVYNNACLYQGGNGCRCAIGVSLNDESMIQVLGPIALNSRGVLLLVWHGIISTDDALLLTKLQSYHDDWLNARSGSLFQFNTEEMFIGFVEMELEKRS